MTSVLRVASSASGTARLDENVAEDAHDRFEVFGQAGADRQHQMPIDRNRQRDAAMIELFGDLRRGASGGAAVDHPRQEIRRPEGRRWIADRSGAHGQADGHSRCLAGFFRDDDHRRCRARRATGARPLRGVDDAPALPRPAWVRKRGNAMHGLHSVPAPFAGGHRQRVEPPDGAIVVAEHLRGNGGDLFQRHRLDAGSGLEEHVGARDGLVVSQLVSDVRHAVVVEDQPALSAESSRTSVPRR